MAYNGWTNHATWITSIHFGNELLDYAQDMVDSGVIDKDMDTHDIAGLLKSFIVDDLFGDEIANLSGFLSDLLDFEVINWQELASAIEDELVFEEEEEEEEGEK